MCLVISKGVFMFDDYGFTGDYPEEMSKYLSSMYG